MNSKYFFFIFLICHTAIAQSPGGVDGAVAWLKTADDGKWANAVSDGESIYSNGNLLYENLNYNQVPVFKGQDEFSLSVNDDLTKATFVICFYPDNKNEKTLFRFKSRDSKLSTTKIYRGNNIEKYEGVQTDSPTILSYVYLEPNDSEQIVKDTIYIGSLWNNVPAFSGKLAEIVIYNRVLTRLEREKVESYLSLKYATPLRDNVSLVSSNPLDEVFLWEKEEDQIFGDEVFGFGSDSLSNFNQTISMSSSSDNFVLSLNQVGGLSKVLHNEFVLWSSNGKEWESKANNSKDKFSIAKEWEVRKIGESVVNLDLEIDTINWKGEGLGKVLWLKHFEKQNGDFKLFRADAIEGSKHYFTGISLDIDQSEKDYFSFLLGGDLIFESEVKHPLCDDYRSGEVGFEIFGGEAPFVVSIKNEEFEQTINTENRDILFQDLGIGFYSVNVKDKLGNETQELLNIKYSDGPQVSLEPYYQLNYLGLLSFDFSKEDEDLDFLWFKEDKFIKKGSSVLISEPSNYSVRIVDENTCESTIGFSVDKFLAQKESSQEEFLYPNPVRKGEKFSLMYDYNEIRSLKAFLYDSQGKAIDEQEQTKRYGHFNFSLPSSGVYFIKLTSNNGDKSFKVIVY